MPYIYLPLLAFSFIYAMKVGGEPERAGSLIMVIGTLASMAVVPSPANRYVAIEIGLFIVDLVVLIGFLAIALFAERYWPMWICSMQTVTVFVHITSIFTASSIPWAYAVAVIAWSYPMLILIIWGTRRAHLRKNMIGKLDWISHKTVGGID